MGSRRNAVGRGTRLLRLAGVLAVLAAGCSDRSSAPAPSELDATPRSGGRLVAALRGEPQTFNPVTAVSEPSQLVVHRLMADLLHINRRTQEVEPALAESWEVSSDGLIYRLSLRRGVLFSDGEPFDADDVVFSYRLYVDEEAGYPGRDLLLVGGEPIEARKIDSHTVEFHFAEPAAVGARLFDSVAILPQHRLATAWAEGRLADSWGPATEPREIAGLGAFRLREYRSGERLVLERNPHYWKVNENGSQLPYLDELVLRFVNSEDAQVLRFMAGETDVIERINPNNFAQLQRDNDGRFDLRDLGPGLSYAFLVLNQNEPGKDEPAGAERRRGWFRQRAFRQALSAAVDRQAIVRLAFRSLATPIWSHVSPGYRFWFNERVPRPARSLETARRLLREAGFDWRGERLVDPEGEPVAFSIITSASNTPRLEAATLVQEDLRQLGMEVTVVPLEHRAVVNRLLVSRDYDACLMELGGGDTDPNPQMNTLLSSGNLHFWRLGEPEPVTAWEAEIDELMRRQLTVMDRDERKRLFDRVQAIMAEEAPVIFLYSPHVLAGARRSLGNFQPAVLPPISLWNVDEMFWREPTT